MFIAYETISPEVVQAAHGDITLIAKGTVILSKAGGIVQEAYYAPGFSAHIIPAHLHSNHSELLMSSSINDEKRCYLFQKALFTRVS